MAAKQPMVDRSRFFRLAALYVVLAIIIWLNMIWVKPALDHLLDFGSFIAAGRESIAGKNPYGTVSPLIYNIKSENTQQTLPSPNLNPPLSVVVFRWIATTEPWKAVSVWRIISVGFFAIGLAVIAWRYREFITPLRILWAICLAGFWNTIALGQIYALIFLLTIGGWILMEKGQMVLGGILLGAMIAIKPNFAFWLFLLGLAGYTKIVLSAGITMFALSILPLIALGPQIYPQWIAALVDYPSLGLMIAGNSSLMSLAARLGTGSLGAVLCILLGGSVLYYTYRQKASLQLSEVNSLGIVSSILITPFAWPGYTILALPFFVSKPKWNWADKLAAACLVFPYLLILYVFRDSLINSVLFGWMYGWGLLLILVRIALPKRENGLTVRQGHSA
jgi:hypothetical protein